MNKIIVTLKKEIGRLWPVMLIWSFFKSNTVFKKTRWAKDASLKDEAKYVKRLSLSAALYLNLCSQSGSVKAFEVMKRILIPIGCATVKQRFDALNLSQQNGMDRLMAFNNYMQKNDEARFNIREYIVQDDSTCHYAIRRCVVFDFFSEARVPELTKLICDVDREFFPMAFPEFSFNRGESWENTIAYGKPNCDFILKKK